MNLNMKTKNVACDEESGARRKDIEVPPRKKLKQARLSFQILSPGAESSSSLHKSNKRKLSDSSDDIKIIKTIRPNNSCQLRETKGNVGSPTFSGVCKQSPDSVNKTLSTPCAGIDVIGHANSSVETSKVFETVIISDETESGAVKNSVSLNEVDRKLKNNSSKGKEESYISNKGTADGDVDAVIVLSDSENNAEKEDLTISSCSITPTEAQDKVSKNETVGSRQDVAKSPRVTDSEQSETDNSPIAVKDSSCGSESEKEQLSAEERTANCESNVSKQISPKSIDSEVNKYVPTDVKTPKSSPPQCSLSEINSKKNTTDIARTPSSSNQNSFCDCNFEACTPDSGSPGSTQKIRKLTPKQLLKQLESAKKKEEKERQRQEREKKKAEEKEEREKKKAEDKEEKLRQKLEKEEQKKKEKEEREEQKRKEKEEKEELKKKEKEEKEKKKQVELEIKNEEKRKKEGKRQAEAAAFTSFFLPKKAEPKPSEEPKVKAEENFMPFEVKADMRLAPSTRTKLTEEVKRSLDQCIESQSTDQLYLDQIRSKQIIPQTSPCTWALSDFKDDILILDDDDIPSSVTSNIVESYPTAGQLPHPKLLQFWENRRPPYWGTWRKRSQSIGPRNPFSTDEKFFDYEIDSDDEWEEEEPGESLHGSDDEKESEDEYEVDNEFFVPHGYLSDEENTGQEDEDQSPEMLKIKLKLLELEFEEEMKQKTERLKPRLLGCIWIDSKTSDYAGSQLLKLLSPYQAVYQNGPIVTSASDSATAMGSPESSDQIPSPATPLLKKKKRKFPEAAIPALIKLIHGNVNRREFLVKEFLAYWDKQQQKSIDGVGKGLAEGNVSASPSHDIFKKSVSNKIKELATWLACPDAGPMNGRMCWYVPSEIRAAHGLPDITLPNTLWNYTFKPKRRESDIQTPTTAPALGSETNPKQLITKFTKKMTEVECRKQFSTAPMAEETPNKRQENGSSPHKDKTQKKLMFSSSSRAFTLSKTGEQRKKKGLVSSPKGQELPKARKNSLMKFMKQQGSRSSGGNRIVPHFLNSDKLDHGGEECIVLSD